MAKGYFRRHFVQKKSFSEKFKSFWKKFFNFFSRHKIASIVFVITFATIYFLIKVLLGPFGFLTGDLLSLSGFFGEKNYLILLNNENELRPTGGFITSFATLKFKNGKPEIQVFGSEFVSIPSTLQVAPEPIERVIGKDPKYKGWVFRDSNFSLDFPENAEKAKWFLNEDDRFFDTNFDAVVSVDFYVMEKLIDYYGPFNIEGGNINGKNLFQMLQKNAKDFDQHDEEAWKNRKNIFEPIVANLMKKIMSNPTSYNNFFEILGESADKKHLLMNFTNQDLQKEIQLRNWAGEISQGNFYSVNIANLGGRKADRFMQKNYFSSFYADEEGNLTEKFSMRFSHEGTYNLQSDRYEAYIRIIRPKAAKIISSSGDFETALRTNDFEGFTEFSHFIVLLPGEAKTFEYEFLYPEKMAFNEKFSMPIYKQPGSYSDLWQIVFRGANDTSFDSEGCDEFRNTENIYSCDVVLNKDKIISFTRFPDIFPPILQWTSFVSLNELELRFSEKVSPALSVNDIRVLDTDEKNPTSDVIVIDGVSIFGNSVRVTFNGMTEQNGEFYRVFVNNLRDVSGNYSTQNPFYSTVLQEL